MPAAVRDRGDTSQLPARAGSLRSSLPAQPQQRPGDSPRNKHLHSALRAQPELGTASPDPTSFWTLPAEQKRCVEPPAASPDPPVRPGFRASPSPSAWGSLICPGPRLHKAHRFRFRGSERGRLRVMIPCWWGLPSSFQGGPWPGKAEARKNQFNTGDRGGLCWCGGKGTDTSLPGQTGDIPDSILPLPALSHILIPHPIPKFFSAICTTPREDQNSLPSPPTPPGVPQHPSATSQGAKPSTPLSHVHPHPPRAVH